MDLLTQLRRHRLLAVVRGADPAAALASIHVLADEGIPLAEVSLTGTDALAVVSRARAELGDRIILGVGTVVSAADAQAAANAGAAYLVTPCVSAGAAEAANLGLPVVVGALTPTEVATAVDLGAAAVKLFPAELGGPAYLRALRAPFPKVPFVPFGGVHAAAARTYLEGGAVAVGVGSPLLGDAPDGGGLDELRARARGLLAALPPLPESRP
ncbi:bifunctional 4-hydroxy-2-oxoglutarate aldolase/2-dehydro-3-deoxy-phosphogluconate aldolase [Rhizomonospora bruguierae]|uniref:bifunctional 4-hydroxy-2-oxoglutarate aldolase/2-dehydro-3-deoxy-phosphogluconate aldolase n=1 Tax=Rhizomonospora bruguierae TaxID=1581705 RepID=UPI001BD19F95|nr:bifunctional 4-hydroxy-2-oxoglutarate aldolase/2-dehydro-3-deoxy-phosphogluconate aldolase [Micromonospora sp. NBRC 107566]